jgi:hypothetical protein
MKKFFLLGLFILLLIFIYNTDAGLSTAVETTPISQNAKYSSLEEFISTVETGDSTTIVGVYTPFFTLPVIQQPSSQPDYVSLNDGELTEFILPKKYGSVGLLAHNYLSGFNFFYLKKGQDILLVYGDGSLKHYKITDIQAYEALKPNSPFSNFVDLTGSGQNKQTLTSADLFNRVYTTPNRVVFQTCIEKENEPSWGRFFVIADLVAEPININGK